MLLNPTDYTTHKYTDNTPREFPIRVTVKAYMLLSFTTRIHTRENPCIHNGAAITLLGRTDGLYVFKTDDGFVGHCTNDAFEVYTGE